MVLEIEQLNEFLDKCKKTLEAHPNEAKYLVDALYNLLYAVFFAGYIRGKDPDFDYNAILSEIFAKFSTDEWKKVNDRVFYEDEDYFVILATEALDIAEKLYPIIERLVATEPIKGPIGRVVFLVKDDAGKDNIL
jgi:hypothetical protein